eukprot:gene1778-2114_t
MGLVPLDKSLDDLIAEKQTRRTRDRTLRPEIDRHDEARRARSRDLHANHTNGLRTGSKTSYWQSGCHQGESRNGSVGSQCQGRQWQVAAVAAMAAAIGSRGMQVATQ